MIDYHGECVALHEFIDVLGAAAFPEPRVSEAQSAAVTAVADSPDAALLGAFLPQLLTHASADGYELELLGRAADLWDRGRGLCDRLGTVRRDLEGAMEDPSAMGAADRFNNATVSAQELANSVASLR